MRGITRLSACVPVNESGRNNMHKITMGLAAPLLVAAMATSAHAADLGGDCCADLEERVAELEATVARKGNRVMSLTVYGQVNRAFIWSSDLPTDDKFVFLDNNNASSRFGFRGSAAVNTDTSIGYQMDIGVDSTAIGGQDAGGLAIRHAFVYIESKQLGRVSFGQQSEATDGIVDVDLSKSGIIAPALSLSPIVGGSPFDGSRTESIKYTSPTIAGFVASASFSPEANSDTWDAALRYAGEFGQLRIAAGIGYRDEGDLGGTSTAGSLSLLHVPSGLFITGAYGKVEDATVTLDSPLTPATVTFIGVDTDMWHVKGGIEKNFGTFGATTLYGEYADLDDVNSSLFGVGIVQGIDAAATDLYLGYRHYDVDGTKLDAVVGGMVVRF
jgi:predicted porin